jgi:hypothetical protein
LFVEVLEQLDIGGWAGPFPGDLTGRAERALEDGRIVYAPGLRFGLSESEQRFLSPEYLNGKSKNISFHPATGALGGTSCQGSDRRELTAMLRRFFSQATELMQALCPTYKDALKPGLASFRPAEIAGRSSSWRKDDTRLHVDAFPSRPNQGRRILRLFTNVNAATSRLWRAGEPFEQAAKNFLPRLRPPFPGSLWMLERLHITKGKRTLYDHFMLGIHDAMKADERYQAQVQQAEIAFPAGATWACFTDAVSHAAMSGQHAFEQTFYLPVNAMRDPSLAPVRVLERELGIALVS